MPNVHIPAAMRSLTGGEAKVAVTGRTLGEVIDRLDERYPGLKCRMTEGGKLRRGLAAFVNDQSPNAGLQTAVGEEDEIYFAPAIAGGGAPGRGPQELNRGAANGGEPLRAAPCKGRRAL